MKLLVSLVFSLVSLAPAVWAGGISGHPTAGVSFGPDNEALFLTASNFREDFHAMDAPGGPADGPLFGNDGPPSGGLTGDGFDAPPNPLGYTPDLPADSQAPEPDSALLLGAGLAVVLISRRFVKRTQPGA